MSYFVSVYICKGEEFPELSGVVKYNKIDIISLSFLLLKFLMIN